MIMGPRLQAVLPQVMQDGRTIPTPEVHALMLELLALEPGMKVLEVGSGSGTTAQVIAHALCKCGCPACFCVLGKETCVHDHCNQSNCKQGITVHSVELEPVYPDTLTLSREPVYFHQGDGKLGLKSHAPYDRIVATCGVGRVPEAWEQQLKDGGRLVCPLGTSSVQRLTLHVKEHGMLKLERIRAYVRFSMMK